MADLQILKRQWWEESPTDAAKSVVSLCEALERAQAVRRRRNLMHARLYSNQNLSSIYDHGICDVYDGGVYLTLNVIQSCVDTITAKIGRSKPRTQFLTERGNWGLKTQARQLTTLVEGILDGNDWHGNESSKVFADATLFGSGVTFVEGDPETEEIVVDRVLPDEVLFDETEAMYGMKSLGSIFRKRYVHRQVLLRQYGDSPEKCQAIERARGTAKAGVDAYAAGEMIPVYLGWHRASRRGKDDGKAIVCISGEGGLLDARPWKRAGFPCAFFAWQHELVGLWGRSLASELVPIQLKLNDLLDVIDEGQKLNCVVRTYVADGLVNEEHLTNLVGTVIKVNGSPAGAVQEQVGTGASPELYQEVETWYRRAFEKTGISQLSAAAIKPEGINSAVALREVLDREDMRFATVGQRWERFHTDVGELIVEAADELYESKPSLTVQVAGEKFLQSIPWRKVDLGKSKFVLRPTPTSSLPSTPAAKKQYVQDLYETGAIDRAMFLQLLELPDTASAISLVISSLEVIDRAIETMLEEGRPQQPEPYCDLEVARTRVMQAYLVARNDSAPEKRLEYLRRYIDRCTEMLSPKQGAPGATQPGASAEAPAPDAPAPTDQQQLAPDLAAQAPPPVEPVPPVQPTPQVQ